MKFLKKEINQKILKVALIVVLTCLISGISVNEMSLSNESEPIAKYTPNEVELINTHEEIKEKQTKLDEFLINNEEQLRFFSRIFDMNYDEVIIKIKEINPNADDININNIGRITDGVNIIDYSNVDRGILEFFLMLEEQFPQMIQANYEPYTGNAEYVEALIEYFSSLYPNVDHKVMLSIGAAESGYFTANNMLAKNNIYGGMSSSGLITYKNIEYGVLQYIKRMSISYYGKGLNTVESIGYVFCPTVNENGVKVASNHWLNLVNKALTVYTNDLRYVSIAQLNDLVNSEI